MNSLQITSLKANSMLNVIVTADKEKDGKKPGSYRKNTELTADQPIFVRHSTDEEIKVSGLSDNQTSATPIFSRPVDQLRKSKVEARQAKRNMFRDKLEKQKLATGDKIMQ